MGRLVGFEPTHIGTTIRGLNRLTTDAIFRQPQVYQIKLQNQVLPKHLKKDIVYVYFLF